MYGIRRRVHVGIFGAGGPLSRHVGEVRRGVVSDRSVVDDRGRRSGGFLVCAFAQGGQAGADNHRVWLVFGHSVRSTLFKGHDTDSTVAGGIPDAASATRGART
jgi:hypothetical protein